MMKIDICGIPHEIVETEDPFNSDTLHLGQISYPDSKIYINKALDEANRKETLLHEMLHGIFMHLGYHDINDNEQIVQALANALAQSVTVNVYGTETV